ncbi:MAG: hypothetical protein A2Z29_11165 [Chloroflexi bacterium RBG_16_56_11]|nr:MAG: hypothetical protein A2Z29_11165 [Chloroflexi bacterium RBG_16_56_11]
MKRVPAKSLLSAVLIFSVIITGIAWAGLINPRASAATSGIDLVVENISLSPANPVIADTVSITVTIKNSGTELAPDSYVVCYVDASILSTQAVAPLAAGTMTTKTFTWQAQPGLHTVKATADSSELVPETDETNNTRTFTFTTLAPDLFVESLSWSPVNPSRNDKVTFSITVKNQGNAKSAQTNVNFFIDASSKGYQNIAALDPETAATVTYEWYAPSGQHDLRTVVDESNIVKESDENNNEYSLAFSTYPPDLIIQSITWSPQNPSKNDQVTFTITVKNQGNGRSDSCFLGYYFDEQYQAAFPIASLAAGATAQLTVTKTITATSHSLRAVIDLYKEVLESDNDNNESNVRIETSAPDLVAKDLTWIPSNAGVGDTLTFTATIKNEGIGRAEASHVAYVIGGSFWGYADIAALAAGAQATTTFQVLAQFGEINVMFITDSDNKIQETNEANNIITKSVPIILPDLSISSINWAPINPAIGDTVTFTVTLVNLSGGKAENFYLGYFIDDTLLISESIYSLGSHANITKTCTWTAKNGRHTFRAVADSTTHITETDENNNEDSIVVVPYMPDLAVGIITWSPADMPAGSEVTFSIEIKNTGSLKSGPSRVTYYVDDTIAGYQDIEGLAAGDKAIKAFPWVTSAGPHSLDVVTDSNDQIMEIDEDNNSKHVDLPPPDLVIQSIMRSPENVSIGDNVTFTATVKNQGKNKSLGTQVAFYLDDEYILSQDLPEIVAGGTAESSFEWFAVSGKHSIRIDSDVDNLVTETDETNNDMLIDFSTLTPDLVMEDVAWFMENPLVNNDVTIIITVRNDGTDVSPVSRLRYRMDSGLEKYLDTAAIPPGETASLELTAAVEAGPHVLNVLADADDDVTELDELNNTGSLSFDTIIPDLIVKSITILPADASPGEKVTVTVKIENRGLRKALKTRVSLLVNDTTIDDVDIEAIDMGAVVPATFTWTAEAGTFEFGAVADIDEMVLESNEGNNIKTRSVTVARPEPTPSATVKIAPLSSADKGFLDSWWWIILVAGVLLGATAFVSALRAIKKG